MVSNKFEEDNKNIEQSHRKLGQIEEEVHERNRKINGYQLGVCYAMITVSWVRHDIAYDIKRKIFLK